jgi:hypothetical protein
VQRNASEKHELLGGWMSAENSSTAACAPDVRATFRLNGCDSTAIIFSYMFEEANNATATGLWGTIM